MTKRQTNITLRLEMDWADLPCGGLAHSFCLCRNLSDRAMMGGVSMREYP